MITQLVQLSVNGERVQRVCEPRTHLGDFLRKELGLTGTHLSCEHGVCGACTVLIDGAPQRSCITFAVACDDAEVTTIEGYGTDPVMAALRRAFHEHHALQCGYCTPGMLCTARDIVLRLPGPDAQRVRNELAGNICRCTGYVGIVEAIESVLALKARGELAMPAAQPGAAAGLGHGAGQAAVVPPGALTAALGAGAAAGAAAGSAAGPAASAARVGATAGVSPATAGPAPSAPTPDLTDWAPILIPADGDWIEVAREVSLPVAADEVWHRLQDLPLVARCLPGASVARHAGERAEGHIDVRFGPITAAFAMRAELFLDAPARIGRMHAEGTDRLSGTRVKTRLHYAVLPDGPGATRLELRLAFQLAGPLAQFSRAGLVTDYVNELARRFGLNLQQAAAAPEGPAGAPPAPLPQAEAPSVLGLLWARVRRWLGLG
jgi:carbon-monoxide dehydrogenase small subunit